MARNTPVLKIENEEANLDPEIDIGSEPRGRSLLTRREEKEALRAIMPAWRERENTRSSDGADDILDKPTAAQLLCSAKNLLDNGRDQIEVD